MPHCRYLDYFFKDIGFELCLNNNPFRSARKFSSEVTNSVGLKRQESIESTGSLQSNLSCRSRSSRRVRNSESSETAANAVGVASFTISKFGEKVAEAAKAAIRRGSSIMSLVPPNDDMLLGNNIISEK